MRLNRLSIISFVALLGLGFASCERQYDAPLLTEPKVTVGNEGIITIAQYKEKYKSVPTTGKLIEEDFAIRAVVVGNDVSGNIYKQIYVQDATGGMSIGIDQNNIANDYQVGQEVFIKLQGLAATSYGGVIQIGMMNTQSNRIPYEIAKKHILKNKWPNEENAQPKKVTMGQLTDEMVGTLIELENVYFELGGTAPYSDQAFNAINRNLKDTSGHTLYVRNSKYATFANDIMPKGNGTVVGILSKFNNDYQFFIRTKEDCYGFSGKDPVTGGTTPAPTPDPTTGSVIFTEAFTADLGKFTAVNVSGTNAWRQQSYQGKTYATMTGFTGGASAANEDWLVSPVFDLSSAKSASVAFQHTINKGDVSKMKQEQTLWVSTNYAGNVATATWTQVAIPTYPAGNSWTYVESGSVVFPASVLGQARVVFAFKYTCTNASSGQWQVQDIKVTSEGGKLAEGGTTPTPDPVVPKPDPVNPTPTTGGLLFTGADFENWAGFLGVLNSYGLQSYVKQADGGRSGKAMHINGTPTGNDWVFTANAPANSPSKAKTITLYIKGNSTKSLSFCLYQADGKYAVFNLDAIGADGYTVTNADKVVLTPAPLNTQGNGTNSYAKGSFDTKGDWLLIRLDVSTLNLATSGSLFGLKVGKDVAYDVRVDDITIQ